MSCRWEREPRTLCKLCFYIAVIIFSFHLFYFLTEIRNKNLAIEEDCLVYQYCILVTSFSSHLALARLLTLPFSSYLALQGICSLLLRRKLKVRILFSLFSLEIVGEGFEWDLLSFSLSSQFLCWLGTYCNQGGNRHSGTCLIPCSSG